MEDWILKNGVTIAVQLVAVAVMAGMLLNRVNRLEKDQEEHKNSLRPHDVCPAHDVRLENIVTRLVGIETSVAKIDKLLTSVAVIESELKHLAHPEEG